MFSKNRVLGFLLIIIAFLAINSTFLPVLAPPTGNIDVTSNSYDQNEPNVAFNPLTSQKLVVGYNDYRTSAWKLGWSWSDNGGATWTFGGDFSVSGYSRGANPIVAFDSAGTAYFAGLVYNPHSSGFGQDGSIFLAKSNDGGHTFSVFQKVVAAGSGLSPYLDRPWMCVNPVNNHIYLAWVRRTNAWAGYPTEKMTIWFTRSIDGGTSFSTPVQVGSDLNSATYPRSHGPQIAVGPGNAVYVSWHTVENGTLGSPSWQPPKVWISQSTDDGVIFGSSYLVATKQNSYPAMFISMGTYPPSGRIYIAYAERPTISGDLDIYVATATSVAGPWTIKRVNDDPVGNGKAQIWPSLNVAPNGRADVIWYDYRASTTTTTYLNVYYSASRDGGTTWEANTKVTSTTPGYTPATTYAGDFVGSIASLSEKAQAVWGDNRLGNQEVYTTTLTMPSNDYLVCYDPLIKSGWATTAPTINGAISSGEWNDATQIELMTSYGPGYTPPTGVYARFKNDATYLYVLYEVDFYPYYSTIAWITFDTDNNHAYTAGKEQDFMVAKMFGSPGVPGSGAVSTTHSVSTDSLGTFAVHCSPFNTALPNHGGLAVGIALGSTPRDSRSHPLIEWRIPLALLGVTAGQTMGLAISGPSRDGIVYGEYLDCQWPKYRSISGPRPITEYGDLTLASPPPSNSFTDGFESGSFSAWTGTSATSGETKAVTNALKHHGTYGANFTSNGNGGTERAYSYKTIAPSSELYARGYFMVATSGIVDNDDRFYFLIIKAGTTPVAFAGWRKTGGVVKWNLIIRDGTGWPTSYSTSTPSLNQWYSVELHWKKDAAAGLGELYVNGNLVCSLTGKNTATYGNAERLDFGLPEITNCAATTIYGDCAKAAMTYIYLEAFSFADGFESGNFNAWTGKTASLGETATVTNTIAHHGTYSASFTSNGGGGTEYAYCYKTLSPSQFEVYARGYFSSTSAITGGSVRFIMLRAGSTVVASVGLSYVSGVWKWNLRVRNGAAWVDAYGVITPPPISKPWLGIELHWKEDALSGMAEMWQDGVKVCSITSKNTAAYGDVSRVDFGMPEIVNCPSTITLYCDCTAIKNTYITPEP